MSSSFFTDGLWLITAISFVGQTLYAAVAAIGLFLALRRWHVGGRSARLAAAGFGLSLFRVIAGLVMYFLPDEGWTFYTPYSTDPSPSFWPQLALTAVLTFSTVVSGALLLAALYSAWRRWERADVTDPGW